MVPSVIENHNKITSFTISNSNFEGPRFDLYICKMLISIFSWFFHTIFKDSTEQILYPKCNRMHHFASFWKKKIIITVYRNIFIYIEWHCCVQWEIILINIVIFNGRYFIHPIFSWFFHTIFKDLTEQILYPKCNRMHHFASFWKKNLYTLSDTVVYNGR
jgi:uncharacterized protein Usg